MNSQFRSLREQAEVVRSELDEVVRRLADARRAYFENRTEASAEALDHVQQQASSLMQKFTDLRVAMEKASGLPPEVLRQLGSPKPRPAQDNLLRESLRSDLIPPTGLFDDELPKSLERLSSLLPNHWLHDLDDKACRLTFLCDPEAFLSLTKGVRAESEQPLVHRFKQAIRVAKDYVEGHPFFDHFAGALLAPSLAQLGSRLALIA